MRRSTNYCLDLPDDFPEVELTGYMSVARKVLLEPQKSVQWKEFAGASNLIGWRYRASYEDWQYYKTSLATHSNPDHEELYRRERALFGMFTGGVSCIESTVYSLAALASHPSVLALPFGPAEQRRCTPSKLRDWLVPHTKASAVSAALNEMHAASEWRMWGELRNRMTHRSNLPLVIHAWTGTSPPPIKPLHFAATSSTPAVKAETTEFDVLHEWLAKTLGSLLVAGAKMP